MREIEFRGKDVETGEWRYGKLLTDNNPNQSWIILDVFETDNENRNDTETIKTNGWEIDPETIGQYIGKKDKNGVKIFMGDIIKFSGGGVWSVYYCEDNSMFRLRNGGLTCCVVDGKLYSVIGNVTDNPELLGG